MAEQARDKQIRLRGLLASRTDQWRDAVADLEQYLRDHPDDLEVSTHLGKVHAQLGQSAKAAEAFANALRIAPNDYTALVGSAEQATLQGKLEAAVALYSRARKIQPDLPESVANAYGQVLYRQAGGWRTLKPTRASGTNGATLKLLPDGITLASWKQAQDQITIETPTDGAEFTSVRLEFLPDATTSATHRNRNASSGGVSEFKVWGDWHGQPGRSIEFAQAWADSTTPQFVRNSAGSSYQRNDGDISKAIDSNPQTMWMPWGSDPHVAIFSIREKLGKVPAKLTFRLLFPYASYGPRRIRLSVTHKHPAPGWDFLLANGSVSGWVKLAAAFHIRGETASAIDALRRRNPEPANDPQPGYGNNYPSLVNAYPSFVGVIVHDRAGNLAEARRAFDQGAELINSKLASWGRDEGPMLLAVEAASRMIEAEPAQSSHRRSRANWHAHLGQFDAAIADFDFLLKANPSDLELLLERGECHARMGVLASAKADFAAAFQLNPESAMSWLSSRASKSEQVSDFSTAVLLLTAVAEWAKGKPAEVDILLRRARCFRYAGENDKAIADYSRVLALKPDLAEAWVERGCYLAEKGLIKEATADIAAGWKINPNQARLILSQKGSQFYNQNTELALFFYDQAVENQGQVPPQLYDYARLQRGNVLMQMQRYEKAIEDFTIELKQNPQVVNTRFNRAECYALLGKSGKAAEDLTAVHNSVGGGVSIETLYRNKLRQYETALNWQNVALLLDARLACKLSVASECGALRSRAKARLELRRFKDALVDCHRLLVLVPNDPKGLELKSLAYVSYAEDLRLSGKPDEANALAAQAKAFLKKYSAAEPDNAVRTVGLVNFLLTEAAAWRPFDVTRVTSMGGASMRKLPDASILVEGTNPQDDTFELVAKSPQGFHALRIDAIPDRSLPLFGPGRNADGNFFLTRISLSPAMSNAQRESTALPWRGAFSTTNKPEGFDTNGLDGPRGAIDGNRTTSWANWPRPARPCSAVFAVMKPVDGTNSTDHILKLEFADPNRKRSALGRFRVAYTASPYALELEQIVAYPTGDWAQMAIGYALLGERNEAETALRKAETITVKDDGGVLILQAWAHQLLQHEEPARLARTKVLDFLRKRDSGYQLPIPAVAANVLAQAIHENAGVSAALAWRARALEALGNDDTALAEYDRAIAANPNDPDLYAERADIHARAQRWKLAAADLQRTVQLNPKDHFSWFRLAPLLLWIGDEDAYRRHRSDMLKQFGGTKDLGQAERTTKVCSLLPATAEESRQLVTLGRRALGLARENYMYSWSHLALGMGQVRSGEFRGAINSTRNCREVDTMQAPPSTPFVPRSAASFLVEALAHHGLKDDSAARKALDQANAMVKNDGDIEQSLHKVYWNDALIHKLLLREVRKAIDDSKSK